MIERLQLCTTASAALICQINWIENSKFCELTLDYLATLYGFNTWFYHETNLIIMIKAFSIYVTKYVWNFSPGHNHNSNWVLFNISKYCFTLLSSAVPHIWDTIVVGRYPITHHTTLHCRGTVGGEPQHE